MSSPTLADLAQQIAGEVLQVWWQHAEQGTEVCVPHLREALTGIAADDTLAPPLLETLNRRLALRFGAGSRVAARAIEHIGPPAAAHRQIIPWLVARAGDSRSGAQHAAIDALGRLGPASSASRDARSLLLHLLRHQNLSIAAAAARALRRLVEHGDADLGHALADAAAESKRVTYLLNLVHQELGGASEGPRTAAEEPARPEVSAAVVIRWTEELQVRDPVTRAHAARRLAEAGSAGVRIFGAKRQVRVMTPQQLQIAAAMQQRRHRPRTQAARQ